MKTLSILAIFATLPLSAERKPLPGQAGNDDVELVASVIVNRDEIKDALGADLGAGYVIARMKVTPKTDKPLPISLDDFTMVSGKDGQRSVALEPGQIAGKGALVVKPATNQPGGYGTATNGPIWGGVGPIGMGTGNRRAADPGVDTKVESGKDEKDNPLLAVLKAKVLPEKESTDPVEGLLYFPIDGKIQPKDLRIIYTGQGGRLIIEFANPPKKKKDK
jgi:hypothetical protein